MDYGIFNVHTDVNACDCTLGCTDKCLHWKLTLGEKSLAAPGNRTSVGGVPVRRFTNWATYMSYEGGQYGRHQQYPFLTKHNPGLTPQLLCIHAHFVLGIKCKNWNPVFTRKLTFDIKMCSKESRCTLCAANKMQKLKSCFHQHVDIWH